MTPTIRTSLAPRGEIPTTVLIRHGLQLFDTQHLESIEKQLTQADRQHQLNRLGKTTLRQVQSRLAKQRLASLFAVVPHAATSFTQAQGG